MRLTTRRWLMCGILLLNAEGFLTRPAAMAPRRCRNQSSKATMLMVGSNVDPQVIASGYSQAIEMVTALEEAVDMALEALPSTKKIDLAIVSVSSLYDGNSKPSDVVPTVLREAPGVQNLIGCTNGGFISSLANLNDEVYSSDSPACRPIEREGVPGVTVTFMMLPDVTLKTFHVNGDNFSDTNGAISSDDWKRSVGLSGVEKDESSAILTFPSPAFQPDLNNLLQGFEKHVTPNIVGAIASTVSSLSRARLFRYTKEDENCVQTLADGCVGVVLGGDIQIQSMVAQGAKPVGGIYQIVKGEDSTISAIALDESATEMVQQDEDIDEEQDEKEDILETSDAKAKLSQAYAKARIPKPVLAEANFLMKTLSDDDRAFMAKALLVGLERRGGYTPSDLVRLAEGKGHGFTVHQVASAGMKDGSVTFSLGSVDIQIGQRLRFYVRDSAFAKEEACSLWTGYNQRILKQAGKSKPFKPTGCLVFPTLDRGSKFFAGKAGFESENILNFLPTIPSISGFFGNGVVSSLSPDCDSNIREETRLSGSASGYFVFGSVSERPIYIPSQKLEKGDEKAEEKAAKEAEEERIEKEALAREKRIKAFEVAEEKAPRDEHGELVIRRREVHSGRAMTVSTVEWSVADKTATATSALEEFMWDKETEVDRFRERVPLSNLVSQCRLSMVDPSKPKPREWSKPVVEAASDGFVIIPECKRMEPGTGSLRKRYDIKKLTKEFTTIGIPALSVNCDGILFGGTLDDVTTARESMATTKEISDKSEDKTELAPILASDLLLYPYQLYKLRLAGADAVNLMVAALEAKDLIYLTKIAASLGMETFITVTSSKQVRDLDILPAGSVNGLIVSNRNLEDFTFDMSGKQTLDILKGDDMRKFREKHGENIIILAEGRIGIIRGSSGSSSPQDYMKELKEAGAIGAIVGAALVPSESRESPLQSLLKPTLC